MLNSFQLEVVTSEKNIYSGKIKKLFVSGVEGELEILKNHTPFLTMLFPGPLWFINDSNMEEGFAVFGGMLEVQPDITIVLADSVIRAADLDESAALSAKKLAESAVSKVNIDYMKVRAELAIAIAQLRIIRKYTSSIRPK